MQAHVEDSTSGGVNRCDRACRAMLPVFMKQAGDAYVAMANLPIVENSRHRHELNDPSRLRFRDRTLVNKINAYLQQATYRLDIGTCRSEG